MVSITEEEYSEASANKHETEKLPKSVYVVAQEIKIVKSLASNDLNQRNKQLRKLKKWLNLRTKSSFPFSDEDFLRIWKGLYYCMWMSDKPLIQESLAEELGSLLNCFSNYKISSQFFGAFLKTMSIEWFGIDQWRLDKFLMLVRRMLRYMLMILKEEKWSENSVNSFIEQLSENVLTFTISVGLVMHIMDIYLEELAKVSEGEISAASVAHFIKPFIPYLASLNDKKLLHYTTKQIFQQLLWQSDKGRDYSEKYEAWKEMGFPTKNINDLEKVDEEDVESDKEIVLEELETREKVLDPRAGRVDVFMPVLPVDVYPIIKYLEEIEFKNITNTKSRRAIRNIIEKYKKFKDDIFPMGIKEMPKINFGPMGELLAETVENFDKLENNLLSTTRKLKKLSKKKRKKFLSELNVDELGITEDNFEQIIEKSLSSKKPRNGEDEWKEEDIEKGKKRKIQKDKKIIETKTDQNKVSPKSKKLKKQTGIEANLNDSKNKKDTEIKHNLSESTSGSFVEEWTSNKENVSNGDSSNTNAEWEEPLKEGEVEYFIPSRKIKLKETNDEMNSPVADNPSSSLVLNPFAKKLKTKKKTANNVILGKSAKKLKKLQSIATPPSSEKKVKIVLHKNMAQKASEYIQQVRSSPQLPFDSDKKPKKSLLKPNLLPSPINPFYKKKIGLKLNDSI